MIFRPKVAHVYGRTTWSGLEAAVTGGSLSNQASFSTPQLHLFAHFWSSQELGGTPDSGSLPTSFKTGQVTETTSIFYTVYG